MIDISPQEDQIVRGILAQFLDAHKVFAFGSRVNAKARETADLDLMIVNDRPLEFSLMGEILNAFQSSNLPFRVDVLDAARVDNQTKKIMLQNSEEIKYARGSS
jgi:uncharacterized protein